MAELAWLCLAALSALLGMGLLALSLEAHWRQVSSSNLPSERGKRFLRTLGYSQLGISLLGCLLADHVSMAALVWVMLLATAAFTVGMLLAWQPRILRPLSLLIVRKRAG